jgi:photosystem II stability/assembly factor-like uncharacterized protein
MNFTFIRALFPVLLITMVFSCHSPVQEEPSEAGAAFSYWAAARLFPDGQFHTEKYMEALAAMQAATDRGERSPGWEPLGPVNIGGRTLCLAEHPLDSGIIWMGSASGGIWKSTTGGRGATAWQRIETGFPLLGVSSIVIDPVNPEVMYAGTGEVYNLENSQPNIAIRTTRGTYGIGIIKSSDGGQTWSKCLDWSYGQLRAVQDIKLNPLRPATIYAATTEGLLRSYDAGLSWQVVHQLPMAVDMEISPADTNIIYVTHGSLDDNMVSGIYRSENGGASFEKLTSGLPESYSGRAKIGLSSWQPDVIYATIGDVLKQVGLYKSTDGGDTWTLINDTDVCKHQGWYSHDIAVHPLDPNTVFWAGFDSWKSTDGGASVTQKSYWYLWTFGYVPAGGPEGPPDYIHADIHRVYYSKHNPDKLFAVTDGGLFVSHDGGESFEGRNGGYQTQQFYANAGNSTLNPELCIAGMQDNATAIYKGDPAWTRVLGGDGLCAAIRPGSDNIMYGSYQYLAINRSNDGGVSWQGIGSQINEEAAFNGPFELTPSNPDIIYAGAKSLWRSNNAGQNWTKVTSGMVDNGNFIINIAVNPANPDQLYFSTSPNITSDARVFRYTTGTSPQLMTGLPNRYCLDINWHPTNPEVAWAVFGGFNTQHVWRTVNGGQSWDAIDNGLPDVPVNTMVIDPANPEILYIGNDLGVWVSMNDGQSWAPYGDGAPQAMLVMHLSVIPQTRKLRVATHGLGMWQIDMANPSEVKLPTLASGELNVFPNPAHDKTTVAYSLDKSDEVAISIRDFSGRLVVQTACIRETGGRHSLNLELNDIPTGVYVILLTSRKNGVLQRGTVTVRK